MLFVNELQPMQVTMFVVSDYENDQTNVITLICFVKDDACVYFTADIDLIVILLCLSCEKSYILQSWAVQKHAFYRRYRSNCSAPLAVL